MSGGGQGGELVGNWPFFEVIHKALGQRDSIKPLNIIATAVDSSLDIAQEPEEADSKGQIDLEARKYQLQ
ncbi:hypothetical protein PAMP_000967 [Pampus punctatissimus]